MTRRAPSTFTLDPAVKAALEERSRQTGENQSRLVEAAIRMLCGLPVPEPEEDEERTPGPTRSELAVLDALRSVGPTSLTLAGIMEKTGLSPAVANKSILALQRRGQAWRWGGTFHRLSDGEYSFAGDPVDAWGSVEPLEAVRQLITAWSTAVDAEPDRRQFLTGQLTSTVGDLCETFDDIHGARALVCEATGLRPGDFRLARWKNAHELKRDYLAAEPDREAARRAALQAMEARRNAEHAVRLRVEAARLEAERLFAEQANIEEPRALGPPPPKRLLTG